MINNQIVLASNNAGKIKEIQALLPHYTITPQSTSRIDDAEETGLTFIENAIIKARHAAHYCQLPTIADDSGLIVDALDGAPGIFSARYAGEGATDEDNIEKLLAALQNVPNAQRTARFVCVMVFVRHEKDPFPLIAQGVWEGVILEEPIGNYGFGYDPVFYVPDCDCASAQLLPEVKNALSHRGQAVRQLTQLIETVQKPHRF